MPNRLSLPHKNGPQYARYLFRKEYPEPSVLYHYTTFAGGLGILESETIWASSIHYLNDKEEFIHGLSLLAEVGADVMSSWDQLAQKLLNEILKRAPGYKDTPVFVASFTENGDLLSQWRGYAAPGGVSLGFDRKVLEQAALCHRFHLQRCLYNREEKMQLINDLLSGWLNNVGNEFGIAESAIEALAVDFIELFQLAAASFKDESFKEENEWRLISEQGAPSLADVEIRLSGSLPIPYYKLPLQHLTTDGLVNTGLDSIVIGPHREEELVARSLTLASAKWLGPKNIMLSNVPYRSG